MEDKGIVSSHSERILSLEGLVADSRTGAESATPADELSHDRDRDRFPIIWMYKYLQPEVFNYNYGLKCKNKKNWHHQTPSKQKTDAIKTNTIFVKQLLPISPISPLLLHLVEGRGHWYRPRGRLWGRLWGCHHRHQAWRSSTDTNIDQKSKYIYIYI